jgi:hypothetical protein
MVNVCVRLAGVPPIDGTSFGKQGKERAARLGKRAARLQPILPSAGGFAGTVSSSGTAGVGSTAACDTACVDTTGNRTRVGPRTTGETRPLFIERLGHSIPGTGRGARQDDPKRENPHQNTRAQSETLVDRV